MKKLFSIFLILLAYGTVFAQQATLEGGRLILEEITIQGELRTPQALFLMLKSTPNLSNVLLERSFLEDVIRPIYPGAFGSETSFTIGGLSAWKFSEGDEKVGTVFAVMAGLDVLGNLLYDLVGQ